MTESTITPTTMTIGIDLGDRKSHICVLDAVGEIAEESRSATTPKALRARFEGFGAHAYRARGWRAFRLGV